jgi:hypothetical protein
MGCERARQVESSAQYRERILRSGIGFDIERMERFFPRP